MALLCFGPCFMGTTAFVNNSDNMVSGLRDIFCDTFDLWDKLVTTFRPYRSESFMSDVWFGVTPSDDADSGLANYIVNTSPLGNGGVHETVLAASSISNYIWRFGYYYAEPQSPRHKSLVLSC